MRLLSFHRIMEDGNGTFRRKETQKSTSGLLGFRSAELLRSLESFEKVSRSALFFVSFLWLNHNRTVGL